MKEELICIRCPMGCTLDVEFTDDRILSVSGNKCPQGLKYAEKEIFDPERTVTTTVAVKGGELQLLPVKTSVPVPKAECAAVVRFCSELTIPAPVSCGDVIAKNVLGLGADIIAGRNIPKAC